MTKTHEVSPRRAVDHEVTMKENDGFKAQLFGTLSGLAFRYEGWPSLHGTPTFRFNSPSIHAGSHVYISASEVDNAGNRFLGDASYLVRNVVVHEGSVEFRLSIDWGSPLRVSTDILVVNP